MDFSKILKTLRKNKGVTQIELAKLFNVSKSTISMYELGEREPNFEILEKLAQYFNVSIDFLLGKSDNRELNFDPFSVQGITHIKRKKLPILGSIACGEPIWAEQEFDGYISVDEDIQADFCLHAKGDSMIGAGIKDGSIVLVKSQPTVDNGQIAVVLIENEATLKRVYFDESNKRLILNPCNDAYSPIVVDHDQMQSGQVRILGKAVACIFKVR